MGLFGLGARLIGGAAVGEAGARIGDWAGEKTFEAAQSKGLSPTVSAVLATMANTIPRAASFFVGGNPLAKTPGAPVTTNAGMKFTPGATTGETVAKTTEGLPVMKPTGFGMKPVETIGISKQTPGAMEQVVTSAPGAAVQKFPAAAAGVGAGQIADKMIPNDLLKKSAAPAAVVSPSATTTPANAPTETSPNVIDAKGLTPASAPVEPSKPASSLSVSVRNMPGAEEEMKMRGMDTGNRNYRYLTDKEAKANPEGDVVNLGKGNYGLRRIEPATKTPAAAGDTTENTKQFLMNQLNELKAQPQTPHRIAAQASIANSIATLEGHKITAKESNDLRRQHLDQIKLANEYAHMDRKDKVKQDHIDRVWKMAAVSEKNPITGDVVQNNQMTAWNLFQTGKLTDDPTVIGIGKRFDQYKRDSIARTERDRKLKPGSYKLTPADESKLKAGFANGLRMFPEEKTK